ncbi:MAG: UDP-N-acetylglucosamine 1-carboxyvinyltransferase [Lachnospiraceae bacterium]|nr:UDP-N-acetylglucosamine 1-carboxyvinyltransferase [Lachnospiraceae bacterium]
MDTYHISGGSRLEGSCRVNGAKNAVLPILAASLMGEGGSRIKNCPGLSDVYAMISILESTGCVIDFKNGIIDISPKNIQNAEISEELMSSLRSSIFLMGPMLAVCGEFTAGYPGGCAIGSRPIDMHIYALRTLGAEIEENDGTIYCRAEKLCGGEIKFQAVSVGATENAMMAAALAEGTTIIKNAAREPEIAELERFLNCMGASVKGAGTDTIVIEGRKNLRGCEFSVMSDRIEAGTLLAAVAATGGEALLTEAPVREMKNITEILRKTGCRIHAEGNFIYIKSPEKLKSPEYIETNPYPGFPTDMQSQIMTLMCVSEGSGTICENIFEQRFQTAPYLVKMGADIIIDGKYAFIKGKEKLSGARLKAEDLRGGAALVIAALCADGESDIENVCLIDRGYDKLDTMLKNLGANIQRIKEE